MTELEKLNAKYHALVKATKRIEDELVELGGQLYKLTKEQNEH